MLITQLYLLLFKSFKVVTFVTFNVIAAVLGVWLISVLLGMV
jgi:hypothetical protein